MRHALTALLIALLIALACGCSGSGNQSPAHAGATATPSARSQIIFDPGWSDDDTRKAAQKLVGSCLGGAWPRRLSKQHRSPPVLALGQVQNRSSEHVNTRSIARQLRTSLAASAGAHFVLASERQPGDLLLLGRLSSQDDATESTVLKALLLSLSLVDVSSAEVLWADSYLLRKLISRAPPDKQGVRSRPPEIRLLAPDQTVDLSGMFNDYDATALARATVKDLLSSTWLKGGAPVVRIVPLNNRTSERVSGDFIEGPLVQALVRHGSARVVTRTDQARHLRRQRAVAVADAGPGPGQELAATHLISLQLSAATQAHRGITFTHYTLAAAAVSVDDSRTVWSFSRTIQKVQNQAPTEATVR
jgi:penicillin-binding protein activator